MADPTHFKTGTPQRAVFHDCVLEKEVRVSKSRDSRQNILPVRESSLLEGKEPADFSMRTIQILQSRETPLDG
jgi:hypothetical protein